MDTRRVSCSMAVAVLAIATMAWVPTARSAAFTVGQNVCAVDGPLDSPSSAALCAGPGTVACRSVGLYVRADGAAASSTLVGLADAGAYPSTGLAEAQGEAANQVVSAGGLTLRASGLVARCSAFGYDFGWTEGSARAARVELETGTTTVLLEALDQSAYIDSMCGSAVGSRVGRLNIGGIDVTSTPGANTVFALPGGVTIVVNEQSDVATDVFGRCNLHTAALHVIVADPAGTGTLAEAYVSSVDVAATAPACTDGLDNDGDGFTDWPEDPGCDEPFDNDETDFQPGSCENGADDDGDGWYDFEDPDCEMFGEEMGYFDEFSCNNGMDDDGDGLVDREDPDCGSPYDDEVGPGVPQCRDGVDNDGDGLADFPQDAGCDSPEDPSESDDPPGCDQDADGWAGPMCGGMDCDDFDPSVYPGAPEIVDGQDNDCDGMIDEGAGTAQCSDGFDNDRDGTADTMDMGCAYPGDNMEGDEGFPPECDDGFDNDGDGSADMADPDCGGDVFGGESAPGGPPRCSDGFDNDFDGLPDMMDPGCEDPMDDSEYEA